MPDLLDLISRGEEDPISFGAAARDPLVARDGRPLHIGQVCRWADKGLRGPAGEIIHLESIRQPSGRATTRQALARFLGRLNGTAPPPVTISRNRRSRIEDAKERMRRRGFATA